MIRITALVAILVASYVCISSDKDSESTEPDAAAGAAAQFDHESDSTSKLFEEISGMDRTLFEAVFDTCDHRKLQELVTEDFEFLHDKGGMVATNGAQFVENIRAMCERQKAGEDVRSRRELVQGSMEVYPLKNYGAIQTGVHRFYILQDGKPEKAGDIAKFTHVWKKEGGGWKVARVLSYDHKPVQ